MQPSASPTLRPVHLDTGARLYHLEGKGPLEPLRVEAFSLRERLSEPWLLQLVCQAESATLDIAAMLGLPVTLHTVLADGSRWSRSGLVQSAEADDADGGYARYRLEVRPWLALLAHTRRSQVWQEKSVQTIVESVFQTYSGAFAGVQWSWADDVAAHLAASPFCGPEGVRSYTVQYRETDLEFVQRLLAEEGLVSVSRPDGSLLVLADTPRAASCPANPQSAAEGSIRFHRSASIEESDAIQALAGMRGLPVHAVTALAWDYKSRRAVSASLPSAAAFGGAQAPRLQAYDPCGPYAFAGSAQAERAALLAQQALEARHKTWIGRSTVRSFAAGQQFRLVDSPLDALDALAAQNPAEPGTIDKTLFLLTEVIHAGINNLPKDSSAELARRGPADPWGGAPLLASWVDAAVAAQAAQTGYANGFQAIRAQVPWRPRLADDTGVRLNPRPTAPGPLTATVVGPDGQASASGADEIHCDALGRVRIRFDFQSEAAAGACAMGADTSRASTWVRVLQPLAGSGMGFQFLPRIGHEVLVDFFENDFERPYVMASLYNGRGEGGAAPTPGGQTRAETDTRVFAQSGDAFAAAQGNLVGGGHSPAWHGASAAAIEAGGQRNAAALSGFKSKEFGGEGFNQLVFDDSNAQLRTQLASTQHASQLNLGHLIHQADNHRGSFRGVGFELRTDAYGAVRAGQGILISSFGTGPSEPAGDNAAGIALARQWNTLTKTFSNAAAVHRTVQYADQIGSLRAGQGVLSPSKAPAAAMLHTLEGMVSADGFDLAQGDAAASNTATADKLPHSADAIVAVVAQGGLAATAGQDIQFAAGDTLHVGAGQDLELAAAGAMRLHTGQAIGMLGGAIEPGTQAAGKGLTLIAGAGDIEYQAQAGTLQVAAQKDVKIQSKSASVDWAAAKKITLATAGGASLTIEGGNIIFECPGKITVLAGKKSFVAGETYAYSRNQLPAIGKFDEELRLVWPFDKKPVANRAFEITRGDGSVIRGKTDSQGNTGLQKSDFLEQIHLRLLKET